MAGLAAGDPVDEQRVGHREHHGADEQPDSPITPNAMSPPITPAKISSRGRWAPRLISTGRMKLSMRLQTIAQRSIPVPQAVPLVR